MEERIVLDVKYILMEWEMRAWIKFIWLGIGTNGVLFSTHKRRRIS
jgi:hypothetical protein